jgi:hypothetical protein
VHSRHHQWAQQSLSICGCQSQSFLGPVFLPPPGPR